MMVLQFIKQTGVNSDVIGRIKITRKNREILDTIREGSFVEILGGTYKVLHTATLLPIKNAILDKVIYNVFVGNNPELFSDFFPLYHYPSPEDMKECKDCLER